jgi:hypothetical protein
VRDLETWITDLPEWQQEHLTAWIFGIFLRAGAGFGVRRPVQRGVLYRRAAGKGVRHSMALAHSRRSSFARLWFHGAQRRQRILIGLLLSITMNSAMSKWIEGNSRDPITLATGTIVLMR